MQQIQRMDSVPTVCEASPLFQCSREMVSNVETTMASLVIDQQSWPITINCAQYDNALICSPYTTYVTYPLGEIKKFKAPWKKIAIVLNAVIMSLLCRLTQFNRVVQINNNLNSLIRHSSTFATRLSDITQTCIQQFPHHAITFFRVNALLDTDFLGTLKKEGYCVFPDRPAHLFFPADHVTQSSYLKRDLSLLKNSAYTVISHDAIGSEDAERIAELYAQLFVEKHSHRNPIYTALYFQRAIANRWHTYVALKNKDGRIDAFISWFINDNVMTCGPLGYDHSVDQKIGLYGQLVALCLQYADQHQFIFNMGGGSDEFKRNRRSQQTWEYTAVYYQHLPTYRRIPWKMLSWACNRFIQKVVS